MSTNTINDLNNRGDDADYRRLVNPALAIAGAFFFVNGVHVAFFSSSLLLSIGYYATVGLGVASVGSLVLSQRQREYGSSVDGDGAVVPTLVRRLQRFGATRSGRRKGGGMDRL